MSYRIQSQAGKTTYNIKELLIDTYSDIASINVKTLAPGSTVFVIDKSEHYMLNNKFEWVKVSIGGGNNVLSGAVSGEVELIYDGGEIDGAPDLSVVYEGGEVKI